MTPTIQKATMLVALLAGITSAKLGLGPCPTNVPVVSTPFGTNGVVPNGEYYLTNFDSQFYWGWSKYAALPGESANCQAASV